MELWDACTCKGVKDGEMLISEQPERMRGYYQKMGFLRNGEEQA